MPFARVSELPKEIKSVLPLLAQQVFMKAFNADFNTSKDDAQATAVAWTAVKRAGFRKAVSGMWAKFEDDNELQYGSCKGMEIFSTGTHTASNGTVVKITKDDLKEISEFTNELVKEGKHHAPIKLGHKKDKGLPALGWVEKTYIKGEKMFADVVDIPKKLVTAMNHKSWRKRSIELYPNFMQSGKRALKAIALLGAEAPSLKGLDDIVAQYSSEEVDEVLDFALESDVKIEITTDGTREGTVIKVDGKELKDILSFHFGLYNSNEGVSSSYTKQEKADGGYESEKRFVLAGNFEEGNVEDLQTKNKELQKQLDHSELEMEELKNKTREGGIMPPTEKELNAREAQLKKDQIAFDEKQEAQKKVDVDNEKKQKDFEENKTKEAATKFEADVNALILEFKEAGRLLPAQEGEIKTLAMSYGGNKIIKFGEVGKEVDTPVLDVMRKMLEKNVKQVDFAETGKEGSGGSKEKTATVKFEEKVKELQKEDKDLDYSDAVKKAGEEEPELYEEYVEEMESVEDKSSKAGTTERIKK